MARPNNKWEFIETVKRRLGSGVIKIEVTPDQWDDIVDDALLFYVENTYGGTKTVAYKLELTNNVVEYDLASVIPNIYSVVEVVDPSGLGKLIPSSYGPTQGDIDFLFNLGKIEGGYLADYEFALQNISAMRKILTTKVTWEFNFNTGKINFVTVDDNRLSFYILICSVLLDYDGSGTGRYWSNRMLIEYTTALAGIQWMQNMRKFDGFSIPGGGSIKDRFDEFKSAKEAIETEVKSSLFQTPEFLSIYMA